METRHAAKGQRRAQQHRPRPQGFASARGRNTMRKAAAGGN